MDRIDKKILKKFKNLKNNLKKLKKVSIAYSGGVDSTFLLACANEVISGNFLAITAKGPIFPEWETKTAIDFLRDNNIDFEIIDYNPLEDQTFRKNPPRRCYYCKKQLFTKIKNIASEKGYPYIIDGTNADDVKDYRPGLKALRELNILSPLKEAGLKKEEIRKLSKLYYNLPTSYLPSMACFATRIPYGEEITPEKLKKIESIEKFVLSLGLSNIRARIHNNLLRIEIPTNDFKKIIENETSKLIIELAKSLGFTYITIDLEGYRSGSLNETIKSR